MRIALVCTGLGRIRRGFESFTESLFCSLRSQFPDLPVTLFQGGGKSGDHRVVVPNLHRGDLPARWFNDLNANHLEKRSFALALYPMLRAGHYDLVHYNDLTMGSALFHLRRHFGGSFKLLYCNGAPSPPVHYHHRCDFVQVLTEPAYVEARQFGLDQGKISLIPYGIDSDHFHPRNRTSNSRVRQELGIPKDAKLVICVAAIKSEHKRIDYLIREIASMSSNVWLLVAGQRTSDTPRLESLSHELMPGRWRFLSVDHQQVASLYGAADCAVLCSLTEAFGLVSVEAMLSELTVILHDAPIFRWLAIGTSVRLINMQQAGALAAALRHVLSCQDSAEEKRALHETRSEAQRRFSWNSILPDYLAMYRSVVGAP
jgi:Glycosyltransferase